jgi:hypothetical protein
MPISIANPETIVVLETGLEITARASTGNPTRIIQVELPVFCDIKLQLFDEDTYFLTIAT